MLQAVKDIKIYTFKCKFIFYACYTRVKTFILRVPRCLTIGKRFPVIRLAGKFLNMVPTVL